MNTNPNINIRTIDITKSIPIEVKLLFTKYKIELIIAHAPKKDKAI